MKKIIYGFALAALSSFVIVEMMEIYERGGDIVLNWSYILFSVIYAVLLISGVVVGFRGLKNKEQKKTEAEQQ